MPLRPTRSAASFGAVEGRAFQQLGQAASQIGNVLGKAALVVQEERNAADAMKLFADYQEGMGGLLDGTQGKPGYYARTGDAAFNFNDDFQVDEQELWNTVTATADYNKNVLNRVGIVRQQDIVRNKRALSRHAAKEHGRDQGISNQRLTTAALGIALRDPTDPQTIQDAEDMLSKACAGLSEEACAQFIEQQMSILHVGIINDLMKDDPARARAHYANNFKKILPGLRTDIEERLKTSGIEKVALDMADEEAALVAAGVKTAAQSIQTIRDFFPNDQFEAEKKAVAEFKVRMNEQKVAKASQLIADQEHALFILDRDNGNPKYVEAKSRARLVAAGQWDDVLRNSAATRSGQATPTEQWAQRTMEIWDLGTFSPDEFLVELPDIKATEWTSFSNFDRGKIMAKYNEVIANKERRTAPIDPFIGLNTLVQERFIPIAEQLGFNKRERSRNNPEFMDAQNQYKAAIFRSVESRIINGGAENNFDTWDRAIDALEEETTLDRRFFGFVSGKKTFAFQILEGEELQIINTTVDRASELGIRTTDRDVDLIANRVTDIIAGIRSRQPSEEAPYRFIDYRKRPVLPNGKVGMSGYDNLIAEFYGEDIDEPVILPLPEPTPSSPFTSRQQRDTLDRAAAVGDFFTLGHRASFDVISGGVGTFVSRLRRTPEEVEADERRLAAEQGRKLLRITPVNLGRKRDPARK